MGIVNEFKQFVARGNVVDMAVGVIIGLAFGQIVSSLVSDVVMPPIGLLIGGVDFGELAIVLREAENGVAAVTINYGLFIKRVVDFLIIAVVVFAAIKGIARLQRKEEAKPEEPAAPSNEEKLLTEIRDLLKVRQGDWGTR
ncbi:MULTISPECIES: large-conductance mechanosensitive channel protein MscL [unclassified Thioalkalivibrio]|uniref:large-conductance mechanosensitive channel protein MscL n=1 Tax=unclassified Thioalkalivibrio TaxID=2621013 RepID=UPI00035E99BF|nr:MULTISPECIES: large-conductance mechanosensitive channel protein MscL [unclassified Thioalkalivibrio]